MSKLDPIFDRSPQLDEYIPIKEMGSYFEALAIAYECVKKGIEGSLEDRLKAMGISKDFYYAQLKGFKEKFGIDLIKVVDAHLRNKADPRDEDILRKCEFIRNWLDREKEDRSGPRIRLGVSPILCRQVVPHVLRELREQADADQDGAQGKAAGRLPQIDVDIDLSGRLHQKLRDGRIDMYVSQVPADPSLDGMRTFPFNYALVCNPDHPVIRSARDKGEEERLDLSDLDNTTLALIGAHADRSPQIIFPRWEIQNVAKHVRIVDVPEFGHAHDMVACGGSDIATLTIPELLDEDLLMDVELISVDRFEELKGRLDPLKLGVIRNNSEKDPVKSYWINDLTLRFEKALHKLGNPVPVELKKLFQIKKHIYFVRTKGKDLKGNASRGWAHSEMRWQYLRSGYVKGTHTVDAQRNPKGSYDSPPKHQQQSILGWLVTGPDKGYHLVWHGVSQDDGHEAYVASFVFEINDLEKDLVGVWAGRRTTTADRPYEPAAGFMVISDTPLDEKPTKSQLKFVDDLNTLVNDYLERNRGLQEAPPKRWEWQTAQRYSKSRPEVEPPLAQMEEFSNTFAACVQQLKEAHPLKDLKSLKEQLDAYVSYLEESSENP